jgi:hypothetical protein
MRPIRILLPALLLAAALAPYPAAPGAASCAAPMLAVEGSAANRPDVLAGAEVTVTGRGFVGGCDDGGPARVGCGAPDHDDVKPLTGVALRLGGREVGVADAAGDSGRVSWTFTVPPDLTPGPAVLEADGAEALHVRIVSSTIID